MSDHYTTLGVNPNDSDADIARAYKKLAREWHPDASEHPEAEARFKEISSAYNILGDRQKRREYDQQRLTGPFENSDPWQTVLQDMVFHTMSQPIIYQITISLRDALNGHSVNVPTPEMVCPRCHGVGCSYCDMRGVLDQGAIQAAIPAGVVTGDRLQVFGKEGVLVAILDIEVQHDLTFFRRGRDVAVNVAVDMVEAALGCTIPVPTPAGKELKVKVPPGTQSGTALRVRRAGGDGLDLYAIVRVQVPKKVSSTQRRHLEALAAELPAATTRILPGGEDQ